MSIKDVKNYKEPTKVIKKLKFPAFIFIGIAVWSIFQIYIFDDKILLEPYYNQKISTDPEQSANFLGRLLSYSMIFWLSTRFYFKNNKKWYPVKIFSVFSTILSLYGIGIYLSGSETVLWFDKEVGVGRITSTFINQNSYAIYAGLGVLANLAILLKDNSVQKLGKNFTAFALSISQNALYFAGVISGLSALFLTNSRAGIISSFIGVSILVFLNTKNAKSIILISLPIIVFLIFGESSIIRIANLSSTDYLRFEIYDQMMMMIKDNIFTGSGLGTFKNSFTPYKSPELSWLNWNYAHNSYMEIVSDLGIVAGMALFIVLGLILKDCVKASFSINRDCKICHLTISATAVVGLHSLLDFSLQIPAITTVYIVILSVGWMQSSRNYGSNK